VPPQQQEYDESDDEDPAIHMFNQQQRFVQGQAQNGQNINFSINNNGAMQNVNSILSNL
jgi:hypothetical protein